MRYRYVHIVAAAFLLIGMGVQAVMSYRYARKHVQEKIDLKMQLAQEKLCFYLYDAYDVVIRLEQFIKDDMQHPDDLFEETTAIIKLYPQFFALYVAFPEYRYPHKGKWCCPCSYRVQDTLLTTDFGDAAHDYFTREWYKGAQASGESGFWSHKYHDEDFDEAIFTYSDDMRDKNGRFVCTIASDFSVSWLQQLLNECKPFDEAVLVLNSSDGEVLAATGDGFQLSDSAYWIVSRQTLELVNIELLMAVPRSFVWAGIRWGIWLPFVVFLLGIIIVGVLIRRLVHAREESAKLELIQRDMQIAHQIQMSMLPKEAVNDERLALRGTLIPMREVGGDLYDYHKEGDTLWFIIGDVSGKGVPAAMFMSATVKLFRAAGRRLDSPKAIMEEMNFVLSDNNPSLTFVTAFIGQLDCQTGKLKYCNAGHLPPIKLKVESLKWKEVEESNVESLEIKPNIPLGYDGNYSFVEQETCLAKGDTLVLYTDGVTEARNEKRQFFGRKRLEEVVAQGGDILQAVQRFMGHAEQADDITLMTIRHL